MAKKKSHVRLLNTYRQLRSRCHGLSDKHPTQIPINQVLRLLVAHHKIPIEPIKSNSEVILAKLMEMGVFGVYRPSKSKAAKKEQPKDFSTFYDTWEWKKARYEAIKKYGPKCQCCGATRETTRIVVDHIKPLRFNWDLRTDLNNLQVLCDECNKGKSFHDTTDWRQGEQK